MIIWWLPSFFRFSTAIWAIARITSILRSLSWTDWNSDELIIDFKITGIWIKKYFLRLWPVTNLSWSDPSSTSFNQPIFWRNTNFILSVTWQSTEKNTGSKCIASVKSKQPDLWTIYISFHMYKISFICSLYVHTAHWELLYRPIK